MESKKILRYCLTVVLTAIVVYANAFIKSEREHAANQEATAAAWHAVSEELPTIVVDAVNAVPSEAAEPGCAKCSSS